MGWEALTNGKLLEKAETNRFEAVVTVDQNFRFQQNLSGRSVAVCVLVADGITVEDLRPLIPVLEQSLSIAEPGKLYEVKACQ
jgi:hypothetical protein